MQGQEDICIIPHSFMKTICKKLHLWLSVPFGVIITLICFSGAMLVFEKEITEWINPALYRVEHPSGQRLSVDEVAARVAATLPDDVEVTGVTVFPEADRTWQVNLSKPHRASVYVDPYTGEVKGRYERLPFFRTMFTLHRWLLGSRPADGGIFWGKLLVGISTLLLVFVLISGLVLWWPRSKKALRNSLKITLRHGRHRFWYGLHVAGGVYTLLFVLVMALTGLTWSFDWYRAGFYAALGVEMQSGGKHAQEASSARKPHKGSGKRQEALSGAHWQQVYERLAADNPGCKQITINGNHTATVSFTRLGNVRGTDCYDFDPSTGQITGSTPYVELPASGKIRGWIYSLHVGSWGGWLMRIIYFLAALLAASLPLTGYYLWIRRLLRRRVR